MAVNITLRDLYVQPISARNSLGYAIHAARLDPLIVMQNTRFAMRSGKAGGFNAMARDMRRMAYIEARNRTCARAWLPDRKPRNFWDACVREMEKAQVMK